MASYMTTMATTKLMANSKLPTPYLSPDAVVSAHTVAEWELGIPPEPNSRSGLNDRFKTTSMMVFKTWATVQPATEHTSTWFPSISFQISMVSSKLHSLVAQQPVVQLLVFSCGSIPGKIHRHIPVHDLVPLTLFIVVDIFCVADDV